MQKAGTHDPYTGSQPGLRIPEPQGSGESLDVKVQDVHSYYVVHTVHAVHCMLHMYLYVSAFLRQDSQTQHDKLTETDQSPRHHHTSSTTISSLNIFAKRRKLNAFRNIFSFSFCIICVFRTVFD